MVRRERRGARRGRWALAEATRRLLAYEFIARVVLLWYAHRRSDGVLDSRGHGGVSTWVWGRITVVLMAFAPMAIGRYVHWLLLDPWTNPRVPDAERMRRSLIAMGCCLVVVSACIPRLLRMAAVRNVAIVGGVAGLVFLLAGVVRRVARMKPDSSPYRSSPVTTVPSQRWRLPLFAMLAVSATVMFDAACWHGTGWIPARHAFAGDNVLAPIYHPEDRLVEWTAPFDPPTRLYWSTAEARFETAREQFVRLVKYNNPPLTLAHFVPSRPRECDFVLEKIGPNTRAHERDLVFDPHIRDEQLHFTCRRPDKGLAYCSIGLDGTRTGCS